MLQPGRRPRRVVEMRRGAQRVGMVVDHLLVGLNGMQLAFGISRKAFGEMLVKAGSHGLRRALLMGRAVPSVKAAAVIMQRRIPGRRVLAIDEVLGIIVRVRRADNDALARRLELLPLGGRLFL